MRAPINESIQSRVLRAVVAALKTTGYPAHRLRMSAFGEGELPAFNVVPEDGVSHYEDTGTIDREFRFSVRHVGQAVDQVDLAVDPLYVAGQKALFADPTLGGQVTYTREISQKWDIEKGALEAVALVVTYQVEFYTSRSDPSSSSL